MNVAVLDFDLFGAGEGKEISPAFIKLLDREDQQEYYSLLATQADLRTGDA